MRPFSTFGRSAAACLQKEAEGARERGQTKVAVAIGSSKGAAQKVGRDLSVRVPSSCRFVATPMVIYRRSLLTRLRRG